MKTSLRREFNTRFLASETGVPGSKSDCPSFKSCMFYLMSISLIDTFYFLIMYMFIFLFYKYLCIT